MKKDGHYRPSHLSSHSEEDHKNSEVTSFENPTSKDTTQNYPTERMHETANAQDQSKNSLRENFSGSDILSQEQRG